MNIVTALILAGICCLVYALVAEHLARRTRPLDQLIQLEEQVSTAGDNAQQATAPKDFVFLAGLSDRLGRAGYLSKRERSAALLCAAILVAVCGALGVAVSWQKESSLITLAGLGAGLYGGIFLWLLYLRQRATALSRQITFSTPLFIESLILLVESGLGILPALQEVVSASRANRRSPVHRILNEVYELSANGEPLAKALETVSDALQHRVLRHVLLHLDISGNEGGELVPALRSLSDHAHTEWRLSVEQRVKQLENIVVFPVFISVIGLLCLVAAVPIVPLAEMVDSLQPPVASVME